jgi:hypothetical protein
MFNAIELNKKKAEIQKLEDEIEAGCELSKFIIDGNTYRYLSDIDRTMIYENVVAQPYEIYDSIYFTYHSDNLVDAIMKCFQDGYIMTIINNIKFKYKTSKVKGKLYDERHTVFDFLLTSYDKLQSHPEKDKLIMLIESLDVANIKIAEAILSNDEDEHR